MKTCHCGLSMNHISAKRPLWRPSTRLMRSGSRPTRRLSITSDYKSVLGAQKSSIWEKKGGFWRWVLIRQDEIIDFSDEDVFKLLILRAHRLFRLHSMLFLIARDYHRICAESLYFARWSLLLHSVRQLTAGAYCPVRYPSIFSLARSLRAKILYQNQQGERTIGVPHSRMLGWKASSDNGNLSFSMTGAETVVSLSLVSIIVHVELQFLLTHFAGLSVSLPRTWQTTASAHCSVRFLVP